MAHSISSTRALQAVRDKEATHVNAAFFCKPKSKAGRTHTAALHVLPLSGRLAEAQEVKQKQKRREQQSSFPHLAPTGHSKLLSASQADTANVLAQI